MTKHYIDKAAELAGIWWAFKLDDKYESKQTEFAEILTKKIIEKWNSPNYYHQFIIIKCDYYAQDILLETIKEVLEPNCRGWMFSSYEILPDKHSLNVYPDKLEPKEGYGNWTDIIYVILTDKS